MNDDVNPYNVQRIAAHLFILAESLYRGKHRYFEPR